MKRRGDEHIGFKRQSDRTTTRHKRRRFWLFVGEKTIWRPVGYITAQYLVLGVFN